MFCYSFILFPRWRLLKDDERELEINFKIRPEKYVLIMTKNKFVINLKIKKEVIFSSLSFLYIFLLYFLSEIKN